MYLSFSLRLSSLPHFCNCAQAAPSQGRDEAEARRMTRGPVRPVLQWEKEIGGGGCEKQNSAEEILKVCVWIRESGSSPIQRIGRSARELPKMAEFSRRKGAGCGSFRQRADCFRQGHLPLWAAGVCQADRLTSAEQAMADGLV